MYNIFSKLKSETNDLLCYLGAAVFTIHYFEFEIFTLIPTLVKIRAVKYQQRIVLASEVFYIRKLHPKKNALIKHY